MLNFCLYSKKYSFLFLLLYKSLASLRCQKKSSTGYNIFLFSFSNSTTIHVMNTAIAIAPRMLNISFTVWHIRSHLLSFRSTGTGTLTLSVRTLSELSESPLLAALCTSPKCSLFASLSLQCHVSRPTTFPVSASTLSTTESLSLNE